MAVFSAVDKEVTRNNTIIFSNTNNDTVQIDQQFTRLKAWISEIKSKDCRSELSALLCPLFCRLYLEMLRGGHQQSVAKFFKRHQGLFASEDHSRELVEELACVYSNQDIDSNPAVKAFRSCKYCLHLSPLSMSALQKYLSQHGHVIILQVLQTWFDFEIGETVKMEGEEEEEEFDGSDAVVSGTNEKVGSTQKPSHSEVEMQELQEVIRLVREGPPSPCPMLLYTIMNSDNNVACGYTWGAADILAAGFGSEVRLWGLTQNKVFSTPNPNISRVHLACDVSGTQELSGPERNTVCLRGHSGNVQDIAHVPDELLVSVAHDTTMRVWRMDDFSCVAVYRGHNYPIWCVDVSTLGLYFATGSHDRTARLWSLDRTFPLRIFAGHNQDVEAVQFHPNSSYLATGSTDKTVRLWAVADAKLVRVFPGHKGAVQALSFSPDGKYIASAGEDKRVRVWDLAAGMMFVELKGHADAVVGLSWSRDSECLASCGLDSTVRVWNIRAHSSSASSVSHSSDAIASYTTGCSSLLSVQYSHSNTLVCVGVT
ncbi:TAF5-like RNA polymerase II p300/CBP-associated factor-associated factor 65 kDa subunit 5L [Zootermopsis nevadensis]|uniref:TAF5-like RNA polymerase II p300/CBP-associated factor-associated factor 65 kDa subunit 5L n=1 Tax=Zootermopsis nevadensis TaxID=136037 RepID=A0A067QRZ3_ZOONE|nr:TAF5-like RNA polymerase II p300/CBP-associated factor-associated factor 65 kDa subunit 5L [Zootermopsis nevadensis]KDR11498.1 TAF5-like RNA polymerase II p300/CBP-associated factor-associated factor 65 kDa subunit 5L [Zootermopsis nevadensis]